MTKSGSLRMDESTLCAIMCKVTAEHIMEHKVCLSPLSAVRALLLLYALVETWQRKQHSSEHHVHHKHSTHCKRNCHWRLVLHQRRFSFWVSLILIQVECLWCDVQNQTNVYVRTRPVWNVRSPSHTVALMLTCCASNTSKFLTPRGQILFLPQINYPYREKNCRKKDNSWVKTGRRRSYVHVLNVSKHISWLSKILFITWYSLIRNYLLSSNFQL